MDIEEYASLVGSAKIWIATTGPLEDVGPRYFEVGLSKTLLFCNKMSDEVYGGRFVDNHNCVMFDNDLNDFNDKLKF